MKYNPVCLALREVRLRKKLNRREVSETGIISLSYLKQVESSQYSISLDKLFALLSHYKISWAEFGAIVDSFCVIVDSFLD